MSRQQLGHGYHAGLRAATQKKEDYRRDIRMNDDLFLMITVCVNPKLYKTLRMLISPDEIIDLDARTLLVCLEEQFRENCPRKITEYISDRDLLDFYNSRSVVEAFKMNPEQIFVYGITRVKERTMKRSNQWPT